MPKIVYRYTIVLIFIFLMVVLSTIFNEREIIFPELAAISTGLLIVEKRVWAVNRISAFVLLTIMSILGSIISLYSPFPLWINMTIGSLLTLIILRIAHSNFYPILSAMVLPIMMHEGGWLYIIVTICGGALILLAREFEFSTKIRQEDSPLVPTEYNHNLFIAFGPRIIVIGVIIFSFLHFNFSYAVIPPLIVAFVELSFNKSGMRKGGFVVLLLLWFAIILGTYAIYVSYVRQWLPIYISVCLSEICLFCLFQILHRKFAPAAATVVVPALIAPSNPMLYAQDAIIGALIFVVAALSLAFFENKFNIKARYN